jgi:hypothetical protein
MRSTEHRADRRVIEFSEPAQVTHGEAALVATCLVGSGRIRAGDLDK